MNIDYKQNWPDCTEDIKRLSEDVRGVLADRVLVKKHEAAELKTSSGIIIPKQTVEQEFTPTEGTIVYVGKKITEEAKEYEKVYLGEVVVFSKYAGYDVEVKGEKYCCLRLTDISLVLNTPGVEIPNQVKD